jgi:NADH dehydrogenase
MDGQNSRRHVVIVGGGFAGLFAARALRKAPVSVTLVDCHPHHLFQPLLYQCATGILSEGQITAPLRKVLQRHKNVECVTASVSDVDAAARQVIAERPLGERITIPYDYLIMAAGVRQSYFGHDEFALIAPGMKTIADALAIRRRVFGAFEMAETEPDPDQRRRWLTFALVGAGPTGVELAGQIRELATKTLRAEFRHIEPQDARVLVFDGGSAPLAAFGPKLSAKAVRSLRALGVELHMGTIVTKVDRDGLLVRDHDGKQVRYEAATVLWTAGIEAPPVAAALAKATGAQRDRAGRIVVDEKLTIEGHPEIFVVGDMMSLNKLPGVAEVAMQAGMYAGRQIRRQVAGDATVRPFRYHDLGSAAYISRGRAVVSAGRLRLGGLIGWWVWLFIHIAFLTGYRNRFGAILTWWIAFTRDIRRERTFAIYDGSSLWAAYRLTPADAPPADAAGQAPARPAPAQAGPADAPTADAPQGAAPPAAAAPPAPRRR